MSQPQQPQPQPQLQYALLNDTTLLYGTTGVTRRSLGSAPTLEACIALAQQAAPKPAVEFTWHDSTVKGFAYQCIERTGIDNCLGQVRRVLGDRPQHVCGSFLVESLYLIESLVKSSISEL